MRLEEWALIFEKDRPTTTEIDTYFSNCYSCSIAVKAVLVSYDVNRWGDQILRTTHQCGWLPYVMMDFCKPNVIRNIPLEMPLFSWSSGFIFIMRIH